VLAERVVAMQAIDRSRNVFRSWRCEVGTDLFGTVVLGVRFGRTGRDGRALGYALPDLLAAERLLRRLLARRASAERRIGVAYWVTEAHGLNVAPGPVSIADLSRCDLNSGGGTWNCERGG